MKVLFVENHPEFASTVSAAFLQGHALTLVPSIKSARLELSQGSFDAALVAAGADQVCRKTEFSKIGPLLDEAAR